MPDTAFTSQLWEDWIQSGEKWVNSAFYANITSTSRGRRRGVYVMKQYKVLKELYGTPAAKDLRETRKEQEAGKGADPLIYWMKHPDFPDNEERCMCI